MLPTWLSKVSKAVGGAVAATLTAYGAAMADAQLDGDEIVTVVAAFVVGFVVTYFFPKNTTETAAGG
jgi:hypothetical protein